MGCISKALAASHTRAHRFQMDLAGLGEDTSISVFSLLDTLQNERLNGGEIGFQAKSHFLPVARPLVSLLTAKVQIRRWNICHSLFAGLSGWPLCGWAACWEGLLQRTVRAVVDTKCRALAQPVICPSS